MSFSSFSVLARSLIIGFVALLIYLLCGNFLHLVVFAEERPDPGTYPIAGDVFGSKAEGFHQEITAVDANQWVHARLTIEPGASGPPLHYHKQFEEHFVVESGTLSVELLSGVVTLGAGESLKIPPLTAHRPFNPTDTPVVVSSAVAALPQSFAACLVQLYPLLDAGGPGILFQMSVVDPICDTHVADIPEGAMAVMRVVLGPLARVMGYMSYDPAKSLHPDGVDPVHPGSSG